ncbi:MAG: DUF5615 family PIN-like protein [Planctomycetaceae bacterium]|nr:DUF5615 family PIN-like protein [Planctomycetaceae bacterium]
MRFLLNMNMAKAIGQTLHELGHQSVHVREIGLDRADDATVVEYARKENLVGVSVLLLSDLCASVVISRQ